MQRAHRHCPPKDCAGFTRECDTVVAMRPGARALSHAVVSMPGGQRSLRPCPGVTRHCRGWLQANLLMLSFHPDPCRSPGSEVPCVLRRLIQNSGWIFPPVQMVQVLGC